MWAKRENKKTQLLYFKLIAFIKSDLDRIQTCNPQSRNLIFYSVELRGRFILRMRIYK